MQSFQESAPIYQNALRRSNFNHTVEYTQETQQNARRNRQRNIIWFNPPFSKSTRSDIARNFLNLIDNWKHFPSNRKLYKIFNRNTVKVSYNCMNNVKSRMTKHNARIIRNSQPQSTNKGADSCICRNKNICPLQNK